MKANNTIRPEAFYSETHFYSLEQFKPNTPVVGTAIRFDAKSRQIIVKLGNFIGIIPENEVYVGNFSYSEYSDIPYQISSIIGKKIRAIVTEITADGFIILSRKQSILEAWDSFEKGMLMDASVTSIQHCGVFFDLGNGFISFMNRTNCSTTRYSDLNQWFKIGDKILVKVTEKDSSLFRVSCSRKDAYPAIYEENSVNVGDIIMVKVSSSSTLSDGFYAEYTPGIPCIVDSYDKFSEGTVLRVRVKKIKDHIGLKTSLVK